MQSDKNINQVKKYIVFLMRPEKTERLQAKTCKDYEIVRIILLESFENSNV